MRKCISCLFPCNDLVKRYDSGAVALHTCERCGEPVDEYLESDAIRLGIDLCLARRKAFRHTLFNSRFAGASKLQLLLAMLAIDLHYRWLGALRSQKKGHLLILVILLSLSALICRIIAFWFLWRRPWELILRAAAISQFCKLFSLLVPTWTTDFRMRYAILLVALRADAIVLADANTGNPLYNYVWSLAPQVLGLGIVCLCLGETTSTIWLVL